MLWAKCSELIEIITAIICIHMLYGRKVVLKLPAVFVAVVDLVVADFIYKQGFSDYSNIAVYITLIIYASFMFDSSAKELVVNTVLLAVNIVFLQITAMLSVVYVLSKTELRVNISLVCNVLVIIFMLLIDRYVGYAGIRSYIMSQKGITVIIASVCMISIVYGFFSIRITGTTSAVFFICVVVVCSIVCIVCFQWLRQKEVNREKEIDLQIYELYYDSFQALLKEL